MAQDFGGSALTIPSFRRAGPVSTAWNGVVSQRATFIAECSVKANEAVASSGAEAGVLTHAVPTAVLPFNHGTFFRAVFGSEAQITRACSCRRKTSTVTGAILLIDPVKRAHRAAVRAAVPFLTFANP